MTLTILKHFVKEATCYKNPDKQTCIDHILTNHPKRFCYSKTIETGLSDFDKLTISVLRPFFKKNEPKISSIEITKNSAMRHSAKISQSNYRLKISKRVG